MTLAVPIMPFETAQVGLTRMRAMGVQQFEDAADIVRLPRGLNQVHVADVQHPSLLLLLALQLFVQRCRSVTFLHGSDSLSRLRCSRRLGLLPLQKFSLLRFFRLVALIDCLQSSHLGKFLLFARAIGEPCAGNHTDQ